MSDGASLPPRSIKRAFAYNFAGSAVPVAANLVVIPVLARVLGVDGRGEAAAGTASVLLAAVILTFGIPEAMTYFIARYNGSIDQRQAIVAIVFAAAAGLGGVLTLIYLSRLLSGDNLFVRDLIVLTSWSLIPMLGTGILRGIASGLQRWNLVGLEKSTSALLRAAILLILAATGALDVKWTAIVVAYSQCAGVFVYFGLMHRRHYRRTSTVSRLFNFGTRAWIGTVAGVLLMRLDQVLMTPLSNAAELGLYVIAVSAAEIPLIVNAALRDVVYAADAERQDDYRMSLASRLSTCGVIAVSLCIALLAPILLPLLLGEEFNGSIVPCWILLLSLILGNPASILATALSARGRPEIRSLALVVGTALNCVAVFLLVPGLGAIGASWATMIGTIATSIVIVVIFKKIDKAPISAFYVIRWSDLRTLSNIATEIFRKSLALKYRKG